MSLKAAIVCPSKNYVNKPGKMGCCDFCDSEIFIPDDMLARVNEQSEVKFDEKDMNFICMECGTNIMTSGKGRTEMLKPNKEDMGAISDLLGINNSNIFKDKQ